MQYYDGARPSRAASSSRAATRPGRGRRPGYTIRTARNGDLVVAPWPGPQAGPFGRVQFFVVLDDAAREALASYNTYQIIGTVASGMDVVDAIAAAADAENPTHPVAMTKVTVSNP
jgi:hypothetical protein